MATITSADLDNCKTVVESQVKGWIDAHADDENEKYKIIATQLSELTKKVDAIMMLFEQSKGALKLIKWLAYGVTIIWAAVLWAKDHIRV